VQRRLSRRARQVWAGLPPPAHLKRTLDRERARCYRTGEPLSVLVFTPREQETQEPALTYLIDLFPRRLRLTDEAGWLNDRQIAVVLPSTPAEGAWKVADDLCLQFPDTSEPPHCEVYCFPRNSSGEKAATNATADGNASAQETHPETQDLDVLFLRPLPIWKRPLDVVLSLAGLAICLPLFGVIAVAIKLTSPGPVLFRQWRSGRGGKPFWFYKFRTMVPDAERQKPGLRALNEQEGPVFKIKNDPRITRLGRFLRRTSLDELPQLWNVLRGDMSLVGPRPLPCDETAACKDWQRQRLDVTPGLTCIWQVSGRSNVSFESWVRMDMQYLRKQTAVQDLKLLLLTLPAILLQRGAH
jgi:lipopolysaccharide/colanic/teichoic acid biosynthesis glycosyltransferase